MAHVFKVVLTTNSTRHVNVQAESPEEAQTKVAPGDGEVVVEVVDDGELIV